MLRRCDRLGTAGQNESVQVELALTSNVYVPAGTKLDPLEELRELDGIARRQSGRRDMFGVDDLLAIGSANGAWSLGLAEWPGVAVDVEHPELRGVEDWRSALVAGCSAEVLRAPR